MSPSDVWFCIDTSAPLTLAFRSLSTPITKPVSFNTPSVPDVVSLVSERKNCVLSKLSSNAALLAVPVN